MPTTAPLSVEKMTFESALEELETIIRNLETGKTSLEESINAYERGILLKSHCEKKLRDAQMKIEKIIVKSDGTIDKQPLDQ